MPRLVSLKRDRSPHSVIVRGSNCNIRSDSVFSSDEECSSFPTNACVEACELNNKGVTLMAMRQFSGAKESFKSALRKISGKSVAGYSGSDTRGPITSMLNLPVNGATYKHRSEYDEGMDHFGQCLRMTEASKNQDATVLFNLGRAYQFEGKYEKAISLFRKSLCCLEEWQLCDATTMLAILFAIAQLQYLRTEHSDALKTYDVAVSLATDCFGQESAEVAACLNCIGVVQYIMPFGDSEQALKVLHNSLNLRKIILGEAHLDVGTTWNNIGRVYFQQSNYQKAMAAYETALQIRRAILGESVDVAATIFNMGQAYHQMNQRPKAMKNYRKFLDLARHHFGHFHRDIAIAMTCIGQVFHEEKNYRDAMAAFQEALRVGRTALGPLHPEIAITLNKVGNLHYEMGDLNAALQVYQQGLTVEQAVLEEGNTNLIVTLTNIAEIYKQQSEFVKALEFYTKVVELQRNFATDKLDIANTLSSIGFVRHQMGDYPGALEFNQECLRLRREIGGDMNEDVAVTLTHIALVLLKMNMHDIALEVLMESYRIRKSLQTHDTRDIAFTLYNIAMIYHHKGSYEHALVFYRETARVEETALGKAHRDLGITFYNIGQIHYQRGEMELALENFSLALEIERDCLGENHPTCARTLNEIGNIELQLGNVARVVECFTKALRIYRQAGMDDNHLVIYGRKLFRFELVQPNAAGAA